MKWPLVSRAKHEQEVNSLVAINTQVHRSMAHRDGEVTQLLAERVSTEARYAELLSKYHSLKLQGFTETPPPAAAPVTPPVDPVMQAVNAASAGKDAKVRRAMLRQVGIDRKADLPDEEIIRRIQLGNRVEQEFA